MQQNSGGMQRIIPCCTVLTHCSCKVMANPQISGNLEKSTDIHFTDHALARMVKRVVVPVFVLLVAMAVTYGWQIREEEYLTAESGIGYLLGIIGGVLMLSQLLYTLRKKLRFMRSWGRVRVWFQVHMAVGVIAPVVILYHANFGLGSINSNVALWAMALVVASGLVGRYIYTKINITLHGRVASLLELKQESEEAREGMSRDLIKTPVVSDMLQHYEEKILKGEDNSWPAMLLLLMTIGMRARLTRWRLQRQLKKTMRVLGREQQWDKKRLSSHIRSGKRHIKAYVTSVRQVAEYRVYRKIFALWHVLHIPLFLMLVISAVIHVVAVHLY